MARQVRDLWGEKRKAPNSKLTRGVIGKVVTNSDSECDKQTNGDDTMSCILQADSEDEGTKDAQGEFESAVNDGQVCLHLLFLFTNPAPWHCMSTVT
jgi:hypothetical protein